MLIAVNYHYIREHFEAPYPSIFGVTPNEFIAQLDTLGRSADFLGLNDVLEIIDGTRPMPRRSVVITFDDGFREQFELALPILKAKGIPAILFVNTKPIEEEFVTTTHKIHILRAYTSPPKLLTSLKTVLKDRDISSKFPSPAKAGKVYIYDSAEDAQLKYFLNRVLDAGQRKEVVDISFDQLGFDEGSLNRDLYMTKDMVVELAKTRALGTHGHGHLPFGRLDDQAAKCDLDSSIRALRAWTGCDVKALSYPFGFLENCSEELADHARDHKIRFAFTMERAGNKVIDSPYFMARFTNNDVPGGKECHDEDDFWPSLKHATWFRQQGAASI